MVIAILFTILYTSNLSTIYMQNQLWGNIIAIASLCTLVCFMCRTAVLSYKTGDRYSVRGTYLAFKKPKSLQGYATALFKKYGSVTLVINSREFMFKESELIEKDHTRSDALT